MIFLLYLFFLGLCFGSFANVLIWRLPQGLSIGGRSFCPKCKKKIAWYDNIPLFSFIVLGGKCRNCKKRISVRYPIIELSAGLLYAAIGYYVFYIRGFLDVTYGMILLTYLLAVSLILLTVFIIDLEHQLILDSLVYAGIIIVLFYLSIFAPMVVISSVFSGLLAAGFLMLIYLATRGRGMGLGDVKFAVFGGMFVGLRMLPVWLLLAFLTGGIVGIILIMLGKAKLKSKVAFGPFLVVAVILSVVFGGKIVSILGI